MHDLDRRSGPNPRLEPDMVAPCKCRVGLKQATAQGTQLLAATCRQAEYHGMIVGRYE